MPMPLPLFALASQQEQQAPLPLQHLRRSPTRPPRRYHRRSTAEWEIKLVRGLSPTAGHTEGSFNHAPTLLDLDDMYRYAVDGNHVYRADGE
jgi:hypothetical protein